LVKGELKRIPKELANDKITSLFFYFKPLCHVQAEDWKLVAVDMLIAECPS
jgi:hypothetical protein